MKKLRKQAIQRLIYLVLFIGVYALTFQINKNYVLNGFEPKTLVFGVEFIAQEDDTFQLFYRDSIDDFSEKHSQRIAIKGLNEEQKLKITIPDSVSLSQLRFDIGNNKNTSPIIINSFYLKYNGFAENLSKDSILEHFRVNRFIEQQPNNSFKRKVIDNKSDPIFISGFLDKEVYTLKSKVNVKRIALNNVVSLLLSIAFILALLQRKDPGNISLRSNKIFALVFLIIIILPFLDTIFSLDNTIIQEKRELVIKPKLIYENIDSYPSAFESYYNDNFGFRNTLISAGGVLKAKVFKTSPKSDRILVGKNNWLFYWENASRRSYYNSKPFDSDSLGSLGSMLPNTVNKTNEINASFLVSIYPNKHSIYSENVPNRIKAGLSVKANRLDQLKSFLNTNKIQFIGHEESLLLQKKDEIPLFHKLDSHWNSVGAFISYQNLISGISQQRANISAPLKLTDFNLEFDKNYKSGDLIGIMGVDNEYGFFEDTKITLTPKTKEKISIDMKIDENRNRTYYNLKNKNNLTLLIFGDSFTFELLKFIPYHFEKVVFVRGVRINNKFIDYYKPDIVLYGIVQRNLENF